MASLTRPLLDGENRDASATLPALQKLLQLAYSEDTDEQLEVGGVCLCLRFLDLQRNAGMGIDRAATRNYEHMWEPEQAMHV